MSDSILKEHYSVRENCVRDLGLARKTFGSTDATREAYEKMVFSLGLIVLYCPEELSTAAQATLEEATMREPFHAVRWLAEERV